MQVIRNDNMPWRIKKVGSGERPYKIIREATGKVVGSSKTLAQAKASLRARYASESYVMGVRKRKGR